MPEIPFVSGGVVRTVGATAGASTLATTLTSNASANTKGTAVELVSATEFDANWMVVQLQRANVNASQFLVDVLIGSSTEQVIVPDLQATGVRAGNPSNFYLFPVFVPKGSRLAARCQDDTGGRTINVALTLIAGTLLGGGQAPSWVSAYGATASSVGTNVDPGATANTDSAWTQITAATDRTHNWLCVVGRFGDSTLAAATDWRLSVGIGAATEQLLAGPFHFAADLTADGPMGHLVCFPCFVPAGSRLTAMARSSSTTDGDRDVNVKIYGAGD